MSDRPSDGWLKVSLADLGNYINGYAFRPEDWSERGLPIIRIAQITGTSDDVDRFDGNLDNSFKVRKGDLIFSWSGTLAVVRWPRGDAWLNQHLFRVEPSAWVDKGFLFHVLSASVAEMNKRTHGSTMKHIKRGELREYELFVPQELPEQELIAHILDTLDTQIRQTEALIAKLEQIKQGLLTDLLTRGIDENGELRPPPEEAPHLYQDSVLGMVPRCWSVEPLETFLARRPKNGYSPQEAGEYTGRYMLGLGCLTKSGFKPRQLKYAPVSDGSLDTARLSDGDLLMSRSNTRELVGLVGVYRDIGAPCFYPDLMMKLLPAQTTSAEFLELVLRTPNVRKQMIAGASGTSGSMVKLNGATVRKLIVAVPREAEQLRILTANCQTETRISGEQEFSEGLMQIKSALMDDLLTGRIRVTPLLNETRDQATG